MPNLARIVSRITSPDRRLGRWLLRARMLAQTAAIGVRPGPDDRAFLRVCRRVVPTYTMVSADRLRSLDRIAVDLARRGVPGAIVECGTWNGGAAALMAAASIRGGVDRDVWLFDSFEGLPAPTADDPPEVHAAYFQGWCSGNPDLARAILREVGVDDGRVHVVKGWFEDTLPVTPVGPIALLHVDSDWYQSVRLSLDTFYDSVTPGGTIVFDDYRIWDGCRKAVDEFLALRKIRAVPRPSGRAAVAIDKE